jgi:hypothetical protein
MKVAILTASAMKKTINGEDYSGKCITGLDLDSNRIVRFVRNSLGAPVENPYCNRLHPLGVYDVKFIESCPLACQTENVIVDYPTANYLGKFEGGIDALYKQYQKINFNDRSFLLDGSYKLTDISPFKHSLEIIKASNIQILVDGKKTIASFSYRNKGFRFVSVTDPDYKGIEQIIEDAYLVISIPTDDFDGHGYFKFVAAIFPIEKKPWSREEDEELSYEYRKGWPVELMMASHKRKAEEIRKRISFLRL